jgi:thioesterase domain-containing protein
VKTLAFLSMLRDRQIHVWVEGDRLRCSAPAGTFTPELREELRQHKQQILEFLSSAVSLARQQRAIVPLQPRGTRTPVFAVAGHNGDVFCYRALAQHLGEDQPFFGLQPPGLDAQSEPLTTVEDLAAHFAAQIRAFHPNAPFIVAGYCSGGTIAFELARQLLRDGAAITFLVLFGAPYSTYYRLLPQLRQRLAAQRERMVTFTRTLASLPSAQRRSYIIQKLRNLRMRHSAGHPADFDPVLVRRDRVGNATLAAIRRYAPGFFAGRLSLLLPSKGWARSICRPLRWRSMAEQAEEYFGPDGCHTDVMLREPYAAAFANLFRQCSASGARPLRAMAPVPQPSAG